MQFSDDEDGLAQRDGSNSITEEMPKGSENYEI
jgi:hypothetical protein